MRLTHFALALTLILLIITAYLAWEGQQAARGAREELRFVKQQQAAQEGAPLQAANTAVPVTPQATATITPPAPSRVTAEPAPMPGALPLPGAGLTVPKAVSDAAAGGANPNLLTPQQKEVAAAVAVAKVKTVVMDQGFVVINAGSKQQIGKGMKFNIRRGNAVLAKVTVTDSVDEQEAVADLDLASIPTGVTIEPGDEIIHPVGR
jgi:hypothetical protein